MGVGQFYCVESVSFSALTASTPGPAVAAFWKMLGTSSDGIRPCLWFGSMTRRQAIAIPVTTILRLYVNLTASCHGQGNSVGAESTPNEGTDLPGTPI